MRGQADDDLLACYHPCACTRMRLGWRAGDISVVALASKVTPDKKNAWLSGTKNRKLLHCMADGTLGSIVGINNDSR